MDSVSESHRRTAIPIARYLNPHSLWVASANVLICIHPYLLFLMREMSPSSQTHLPLEAGPLSQNWTAFQRDALRSSLWKEEEVNPTYRVTLFEKHVSFCYPLQSAIPSSIFLHRPCVFWTPPLTGRGLLLSHPPSKTLVKVPFTPSGKFYVTTIVYFPMYIQLLQNTFQSHIYKPYFKSFWRTTPWWAFGLPVWPPLGYLPPIFEGLGVSPVSTPWSNFLLNYTLRGSRQWLRS